MAGRGQTAFIGIMLAGMVTATTAVAEPAVPLPTLAPLPETGGMPPPPSAGPAVRPPGAVPQQKQTQQEPQSSSGIPLLGQFFGGQQQPNASANPDLTSAQRSMVDKVSGYLTRVQVMSGDFHQIGPDGRQSKGQFYVQKPGKVRFDYDLPARIDIIADGSSVVVRDRKLATQDVYPLSQTPLRFLLADRIDLLKDTNVTQVYADDMFVTVVVEEKQVLIGTSKLMMMFGAKDFQLKQWVVTDPQGYDTTIAVSNIDTSRKPDPALFKVDYTQYRN
jgi:outer membrane lipoprotein-sorting protein